MPKTSRQTSQKTLLLTLLILTPLILAAGTVYAARVVNPDDPNFQSSDSSIKFKANPQTVKLNNMEARMQEMQARIDYLDKALQESTNRINELVTTMTAQGTTIINMRNIMQQNNSNVNEMMNCGASGKLYTGGRCVSMQR